MLTMSYFNVSGIRKTLRTLSCEKHNLVLTFSFIFVIFYSGITFIFTHDLITFFPPLSVSNKWIHERGQEFRRPCGLTEVDWSGHTNCTHKHTHSRPSCNAATETFIYDFCEPVLSSNSCKRSANPFRFSFKLVSSFIDSLTLHKEKETCPVIVALWYVVFYLIIQILAHCFSMF